MKNRLTALCTAACLLTGSCVSVLPATVLTYAEGLSAAAFTQDAGDFDYKIAGDLKYKVIPEHYSEWDPSYLIETEVAILGPIDGARSTITIPAAIEGIKVGSVTGFSGKSGISRLIFETDTWGYFDNMPDLETVILYDGVTALPCFKGCAKLKDVTLPATIKTISTDAFSETGISEITIPDSVTAIMTGAFQNTKSLTSITLPEGLEKIDSYAFSGSGLTSVQLPSTLKEIGSRAFAETQITSVTFPASLKSVGSNAFYSYYNDTLAEITFAEGTTTLDAFDEEAFIGQDKIERVNIPASLESINPRLFLRTFAAEPEIRLAENGKLIYSDDSIFSSDMTALYWFRKNLSHESMGEWSCDDYEVPATVKIIGPYAFTKTTINKLTLPEGLDTIATGCFSDAQIAQIILPSTLTTVAENAFYSCFTQIIDCPKSVNYIGKKALHLNHSETAPCVIIRNPDCFIADDPGTISDTENWESDGYTYDFSGTIYGVKGSTAEKYAEKYGYKFADAEYAPFVSSVEETDGVLTWLNHNDHIEIIKCAPGKEVTVPAELSGRPVTVIGERAFEGSDVTEAVLPDTLTELGEGAFYNCKKLTKAVIPGNLEQIPDFAFHFCENLSDLTIEEGVKRIGRHAFHNTGMISVTLPASLTYYDREYAFGFCDKLIEIRFAEGNQTYCSIDGIPCEKRMDKATGSETVEMLEFPAGRKGAVELPDEITAMGMWLFGDYPDITSLRLPDHLDARAMNNQTISNLSGLKAVTISEDHPKFTSVDGVLFSKDMKTLYIFPSAKGSTYTIPDSVETIASNAFFGSAVKQITVPEKVRSILPYAFCDCSELTDITIMNPKCSLGTAAICNRRTASGYGQPVFTGTIHGISDSTAESYATQNGFRFVSLDSGEVIPPAETEAPAVTTAAPITTTAAPIITTAAPVITTTAAPITTTAAPVITTTAAPVITTTAAPIITTSAAPVITTTTAPVITTTTAPITTTAAPVITTTTAPITTTAAPVIITTAPVITTTTAPIITTTAAPIITTTAAPVTTTTAPITTTTAAPVITTTTAPITTTTTAPITTTTAAPIITTTAAPIITTTAAPIITTTAAPVITTTAAPITTTAAPITTTAAPAVATSTSAAETTTESAATTAAPSGQVLTDLNGDGTESIADAVLLTRFLAEDHTLNDAENAAFSAALTDLDGDGLFTLMDVMQFLKKLHITE